MLKLAVFGAQTLLGRELVEVLETRDCSVLPLGTGPLTEAQEEADLVMFAPTPALLEGLDAVILADTPIVPEMLEVFPGRILDLRETPEEILPPVPLSGGWPEGVRALRGRPSIEQVLAVIPQLVTGITGLAGTHLCSVAHLGEKGLDGLLAQSWAVLQGEEPDTTELGYRAAFEIHPQVGRGHFVEVRVPVFHGDLLILHLTGSDLVKKEAPEGCLWVDTPPTSRQVAVSKDLLAHLSPSPTGGVLTLGFDAVLWGSLRPVMRLFEL